MRHPFEKFIRGEIFSIALAFIIGLFALIKGYLLLLIFCFYLIALSLFFDAIICWNSHQTAAAGKQFARATLLFLFATFFLIKL